MIIKQLSIFVENKPGRMAEVTEAIGNAGVDIRALSIADTSDFGILRLIVNRPEEAVVVLREAGMTIALTDVIAVAIDDRPGSFARVVRLLSDNGYDLEYMYAFVSRTGGSAYVIIRLEQLEQAIELLQKNGVQLISSKEIYEM